VKYGEGGGSLMKAIPAWMVNYRSIRPAAYWRVASGRRNRPYAGRDYVLAVASSIGNHFGNDKLPG